MTNVVAITAAPYSQLTPERLELLKRQFCKGSSDDEFALFVEYCRRTGLSPEARQIYATQRWDSKEKRNVMQVQASIDGLRLVAERTGKYAGQLGPYWCGPDGEWKDVWLKSDMPVAAKVGILRSDFKEPLWAIAKWDSYAQKTKEGNITAMWIKFKDHMLAKCAEALGLRKAFPQELSGLYTNDEMGQTTTVDVSPVKSEEIIEPQVVAEVVEEPELQPSERQYRALSRFTDIGYTQTRVEQYVGRKLVDWAEADFQKLKDWYTQLNQPSTAATPVEKMFTAKKSNQQPGVGG